MIESDFLRSPGRSLAVKKGVTVGAPVENVIALALRASPDAPLQTIQITGQVRYPSEYPMPETRSLADAILWQAA
ncbi:MAG: hypothetical protein R3F38_04370 [Gammaproteobacteria bacterium]